MANNNTTIKLDAKLFTRRLKTLRSTWFNEQWGIDALAIISGGTDEELLKTAAFQYWFFGYEFTDTLLVICKDMVYVLTSLVKEKLLNAMQASFDEPVNMTILKRNKQEGNTASFKILIDAIKSSFNGSVVGIIDEQHKGPFVNEWKTALGAARLNQVDVASHISELLASKDINEQKCIRTASSISVVLLKVYLLEQIEVIIDEDKTVPHTEIAEKIDRLFENPAQISPKLIPEVVESCYTPIIQSGGDYNLDFYATNSDKKLDYAAGVIITSLGAKYKGYCSDIARTYFIDPSEEQKKIYGLLCEIHDKIIKLLKPGIKLSDLWRAAMELIDTKMPTVKRNFLSNCGCSIGLQYFDSDYSIEERCNKTVSASMVFNVRVGFKNIQKPNSNIRYAMLLADTVLVNNNGAEVLTARAPKDFSEVSYEIPSK